MAELPPHVITALNVLTKGWCFAKDPLRTYIIAIHKQENDPSNCGHYKPISLLNVDLKILSKALAMKLSYITDLISADQLGLEQIREARDGVIKVLNLLHWASITATSCLFLSINAEKAFDLTELYIYWNQAGMPTLPLIICIIPGITLYGVENRIYSAWYYNQRHVV